MSEQEHLFRSIADRREELAKRRREIAQQIESLKAEEADLVRRDSDLEVTERTIQSLLVATPGVPRSISEIAASVLSGLEPEKKRRQRKPDHLPPILQMADEALAHFEEAGNAWATARDIAKFMQAHYWPEAKAEYVQGQLWRAAERGDLLKRGSCYARKSPRNEEGPDTEVTRPLQTNGADAFTGH